MNITSWLDDNDQMFDTNPLHSEIELNYKKDSIIKRLRRLEDCCKTNTKEYRNLASKLKYIFQQIRDLNL